MSPKRLLRHQTFLAPAARIREGTAVPPSTLNARRLWVATAVLAVTIAAPDVLAAELELSASRVDNALRVEWTSTSLTPGTPFAVIANSNLDKLFVCSAGNDYGIVPAQHNSPWTAAALISGASNVLVVESLDADGSTTDMSNIGGHLAAPGGEILSLVILNKTSKSFSRFLGNGDGTFTELSPVPLEFGNSLDFAAGDLNGDSIQDLAVSVNSETVVVLLGKGDGNFEEQRTFNVDWFPDHVAIGDLDGDGLPDVATSSASRSTVSILFNQGGGSFAPELRLTVANSPLGLIIQDLDGDHQGDLIAGHRLSLTSVIRSQDNRQFDAPALLATGPLVNPVLADFNHDSHADLLSTSPGRIP